MGFKYLLPVLALVLSACRSDNQGVYTRDDTSDGNTDGVAASQTIHESSGVLSTQKVSPQHTVVLQLESSLTHNNDTQGLGSDTFTLYFSIAETREYCYHNDLGAGHRLTIEDANGALTLELAEGCQEAEFFPGEYTLKIENAHRNIGTEHTVFVRSFFDTSKFVKTSSKLLKSTDVQPAVLDDESGLKKQTIISFNTCHGCNLTSIDLSHLSFDEESNDYYLLPKMNDVYFKKLNTTELDFFAVQNQDTYAYKVQPLSLTDSNLYGANLSYSVFKNANFDGVNFAEADLSNTVFLDCSFRGANFTNANMERAVFLRPDFGEQNTLTNLAVVSQPASADLFSQETTHRWGSIRAYIAEDNKLYTTAKINGIGPKIGALPNNLTIVSPPAIVPNNFFAGYSIFVKASDGYIWQLFNPGSGVHGKPNDIPSKGWHRLEDTDKCTTNPDASFGYLGGDSRDHEVYVVVACLGKDDEDNDKFYTWRRYFYNKYDTNQNSRYGPWAAHEKNIEGLPSDITGISIYNSRSFDYFNIENIDFAYVDEAGMYVYTATTNSIQTYSALDVTGEETTGFSSRVDLLPEGHFYAAIVMSDGNLYAGPLTSFADYGHPNNGIVATPALGGVLGHQTLVVLSGDGKLYGKPYASPATNWTELPLNTDGGSSNLVFTENDLTEAYFQEADFSNLKLSTNTFTRTFLTKTILQNSVFDNSQLRETVFDDLVLDQTSFKNTIMTSPQFSNNENMTNVDFSKSYVNGLSWTSNISECSKFDEVVFGDDEVIAYQNDFNGNPVSLCRNSFKGAKNIPVELFYDEAEVNGLDASPLRFHDFTSADFKNITELKFAGADMTGAKLGGSGHEGGVDLSGIDAAGSGWENADLSFMVCNECRFDQAVFTNSNLYQAQMNNTSFVKSAWTDTDASYAQFQNATLDLLAVSGTSKLTGSSFIQSSLLGINFSSMNLDSASFNNANLEPYAGDLVSDQVNSNLAGTNLTRASFKNAIVICADLAGSNFTNGKFSNAFLNGANFSTPVIDISADFSGSHLNGVNFENVTFADSDLTSAHFDFTSTVVIGSEGEVLCDTGAAGAVIPVTGSSTICPDGLRPADQCVLP